MKESFDNFLTSISDIESLLDLSTRATNIDQRQGIFRSAIVLIIASWEQFVEQLAENSVKILANRLRKPHPIPEKVKQNIASYSVPEKRNNSQEFCESVWVFADKGWKIAYKNFCKSITSNLNNASPHNTREVFEKILGIRDVTLDWILPNDQPEINVKQLNDLVNLRHRIAHGEKLSNELKIEDLRIQIDFIMKISKILYQTVLTHVDEISHSKALTYSLNTSCFIEIICLAAEKTNRVITLDEIKSLGSSAQGNHNKLCLAPWGLLKYINSQERYVTDCLIQFYNNEISLPFEILVFDNKEAVAKPNTPQFLFSELL